MRVIFSFTLFLCMLCTPLSAQSLDSPQHEGEVIDGKGAPTLEVDKSLYFYIAGGSTLALGLASVGLGAFNAVSQRNVLLDTSADRTQKDRALNIIPVSYGVMAVGGVLILGGAGLLLYGNAVSE